MFWDRVPSGSESVCVLGYSSIWKLVSLCFGIEFHLEVSQPMFLDRVQSRSVSVCVFGYSSI